MSNIDMLINYVQGEECRIAITKDKRLEELYTERESDDLHVGNIYRGKITNVEPSIQAAFVDFGVERNGFLHISDVHPRYFPGGENGGTERVGMKTPRRDRPPIQQCFKRDQEVLVQVLKEGIGTKGPTLTSYISIPGRFLVMMPGMERHGVSRKVEDEQARRAMRDILDELDPPREFGFIVRTAGLGRTKAELKRDLAYLMRLWKVLNDKMKKGHGPAELYVESDLVIRTIRDVLTSDVTRIVVDDTVAARRAKDFLRIAMPRTSPKVIHYDQPHPLFDAFGIESQIDTIHSRTVPLPSGGSLVFDQTEAMVAVDVNSGKFRENKDAESTAHMTNQEAVAEIARQLRLRDLGGLIVLDLIDMYMSRHRRDIEKQFRDHLKADRARTKVLHINELGLLSLTRQRMRPSLKKALFTDCPNCHGTGQLMTAESMAIHVMRRLAAVLSHGTVRRVELTIHPDILAALISRKKKTLVNLEARHGKHIDVLTDSTIGSDEIRLTGYDQRDVKIDLARLPQITPPKLGAAQEVKVDTEAANTSSSESSKKANDQKREPSRTTKEDKEKPGTSDPKQANAATAEQDEQLSPSAKRRRRRRRAKQAAAQGHADRVPAPSSDEQPSEEVAAERVDVQEAVEIAKEEAKTPSERPGKDAQERSETSKPRRRRSSRSKSKTTVKPKSDNENVKTEEAAKSRDDGDENKPVKKRKRRPSKRSKVTSSKSEPSETAAAGANAE